MLGRFGNWLRRVFGRAEEREVLRAPAGATERTTDLVTEQVARKGPLKPEHLRQIVRDERLLPKPKPSTWTKPPKVMEADEAKRLFAGSLRTSNRQLRTLASDVAQLERYGLPVWRTEPELAGALGVTVKQLRYYSTHRERDRAPHYITYAIAKRSGGTRQIHAPKQRLKALLRRVQRELVAKLPVSSHAHGFVAGRSVKSGAVPHVGQPVLLRLDIKDFFPSVTMPRVRGYLIALGYSYPVAATLAVLVTEAPRQPVDIDGTIYHVPVGPRACVQGAPTSPGLCNAIAMRLDRRLAGLAKQHGFTYTRYADDMTFSGPSERAAHRLRRAAERVIREEGFEVNAAKTRVMRSGGRKIVTGVIVDRVLGLSRQQRRKIRAMLHHARTRGADAKRRAQLAGLLAWVQMLNPQQAAALRRADVSRRDA